MSELTDFLISRGYVRIPLWRSAVGHIHTTGALNGRPVDVLVDTGASATVVAMSLVQALGLHWKPLPQEGGGAGGTLDQHAVEGAFLQLGAFAPRLREVAGVDFEPLNLSLAASGATPVEVILGVDVFEAHAAVIDYDTWSLFLKPLPT